MNYKLIFNISKALLLARWRQTLVAAVGVTFGISMFVAMQSFMTGLNKMLDGLILNRTPHIRLFKEIRPNARQPIHDSKMYAGYYNFIGSLKAGSARLEIYNSNFIMRSLQKDERVLGFAPRITAQA